MKKFVALTLALALLAGCGSKVQPVAPTPEPPAPTVALKRWIEAFGPTLIEVNALMPSAFNLLAGTSSGIYRTEDFGRSWAPVAVAARRKVVAFARHGSTVYAATTEQILRSRNDGVSWIAVGAGLPVGIEFLSLMASDAGVLFLGTSGAGIYRSSDEGAHWEAANEGLPVEAVIHAFHPLPGGVVLAAVHQGLYQSSDQGAHWERVPATGLPVRPIYTFEETGSVLSVGLNGGVYVQSPTGWLADTEGFPAPTVVFALDAVGPVRIAGTWNDGLYRSAGPGLPWSEVPTVLPPGVTCSALETVGPSQFAGTSRGVLRSNDAGVNWFTAGPVGSNLRTVAELNGRLVASTEGDGIWISYDEARSWRSTQQQSFTARSFANRGNLYFAGYDGGQVLRSTDGGITWTAAGSNMPYGEVLTLATSATAVLAGLAGEAIHRSIDDGSTWIPSAGLPGGCTVASIAAAGSAFFAAVTAPVAADHGVYVSTDDGVHWARTSADLPTGLPVTFVAAAGAKLFAATRQGLYASGDGGATWTLAGLFDEKLVRVAAHGTIVVVVNEVGAVFRSADSGATWQRDALNATVKFVTAGSTAFYVATSRGVFLAEY